MDNYSQTYSIAVVAYETTPSVCSSMMMHIRMIADCGHDITLVISNRVNQSYFGNHNFRVLNYSSGKELKSILSSNSFDKIWCTNSMYILYMSILGIKLPMYLWMQGDTPAESYMHHHSNIRRYILTKIVGFSFKRVQGIIYVSDAMKEYYETHYSVTPQNNIVVPCLSEFAEVKPNVKRIPNSYVYIGGCQLWQCIDETLNTYKSIRTEESVFHIITHSVNKATEKVLNIIGDTKNIKIYSISERNQIPYILNQFQYGFLIRKHDVVNQVSSPIKFLEYISCGVNVIMTDAVPSYAKLIEQYKIGTILKNENTIYINPYNNEAQNVYQNLFNRDIFIKRYKLLFRK